MRELGICTIGSPHCLEIFSDGTRFLKGYLDLRGLRSCEYGEMELFNQNRRAHRMIAHRDSQQIFPTSPDSSLTDYGFLEAKILEGEWRFVSPRFRRQVNLAK